MSGAPLTGIQLSNGGRFVTIGGGLPIVLPSGEVVGGIGVSAGTPDEDRRVAEGGIEAVLRLIAEQGAGVGGGDGGRVKAKL